MWVRNRSYCKLSLRGSQPEFWGGFAKDAKDGTAAGERTRVWDAAPSVLIASIFCVFNCSSFNRPRVLEGESIGDVQLHFLPIKCSDYLAEQA